MSELPIPAEVVEAMWLAYVEQGMEGALRAGLEAMLVESEDRQHGRAMDCLDGGYAGYQARCWECDWRGPERPPGPDGKALARADYAEHDFSERRYFSRWLPVEQDS